MLHRWNLLKHKSRFLQSLQARSIWTKQKRDFKSGDARRTTWFNRLGLSVLSHPANLNSMVCRCLLCCWPIISLFYTQIRPSGTTGLHRGPTDPPGHLHSWFKLINAIIHALIRTHASHDILNSPSSALGLWILCCTSFIIQCLIKIRIRLLIMFTKKFPTNYLESSLDLVRK